MAWQKRDGRKRRGEGKREGGRKVRREEKRLAPISRLTALLDHLEMVTHGAIRDSGP